mmetsp:Transcript_30383/g.97951  ORF Transcript_30383/g.97951 Transcript_30383/m.97951 type:complete len:403 (-) Transcript_30383:376-1584(-)
MGRGGRRPRKQKEGCFVFFARFSRLPSEVLDHLLAYVCRDFMLLKISRTCKDMQKLVDERLKVLDATEVYVPQDDTNGAPLALMKAFVRAEAKITSLAAVTSASEAELVLSWLFEKLDVSKLEKLSLEDSDSFMPLCTPKNWPLKVGEYGPGKERIVVRKALEGFDPTPRPTADLLISTKHTLKELALDVDLIRGPESFFSVLEKMTNLKKLHLIVPFNLGLSGKRRRGLSLDALGRDMTASLFALARLTGVVERMANLAEFKLTRCPDASREHGGALSGFSALCDGTAVNLESKSLKIIDVSEAAQVLLVCDCPNLTDLYVKDGNKGSGVRRCDDDGNLVFDEELKQRGSAPPFYLNTRYGVQRHAKDHTWYPIHSALLRSRQPTGPAVPLPPHCTVHFCG